MGSEVDLNLRWDLLFIFLTDQIFKIFSSTIWKAKLVNWPLGTKSKMEVCEAFINEFVA